MSAVVTSHTIEEIKIEFNLLVENLSQVAEKVRRRTRISSTKLAKIQKNLDKLPTLNKEELAKTIEVAIKYNSINVIFSENVTYDDIDLFKIIEGSLAPETESNEKYNDFFFEFHMASRFLKFLIQHNKEVKINLAGKCDIIIEEEIAVECKYIHSQAGIVDNVKKAENQILTRIANEQAEYGFVALDLSNIVEQAKIKDFIEFTLKNFIHGYSKLKAKGHISDELLGHILSDRNFAKIIGNYFTFEVETAFYEEFGFLYEMNDSTMAILLQGNKTFVIEYEGQLIPIPARGMTYRINPKLDDTTRTELQRFFHGLAVGL